jgi:predicted MFS family arabinose efflux permease
VSIETKRSRRGILAVVSTGNFAQLGTRLLVGALVPLILVDIEGATRSNVGLALTGLWGIYALLQFPSGVLADRIGEHRLLALGLGGTVIGTVLVAKAPSLWLFSVFVLVLGAGAGLFFSPASALLSRLFEEQGGPLGTLTAVGALAGVIYPAIGGYVGNQYGWRTAVLLSTVVTVPVLAGTILYLPSVEPANAERRLAAAIDFDTIADLFSRRSVAYTTFIAVLLGFTFQAFSSFFTTFLAQYRAIDPEIAGFLFAVVFGLSTIAQPIAGRLSDRFSRDLAIAGSVTLTGSGFVILLVVPGTVGVLVGSVVLGTGISWPGAVQARFMDQFAEDERGFGFGFVRSVYMFLAASGSVVVGTLADVGGWVLGYGAVVAVLAVALAALGVNRLFSLDL